MFSLPNTYPVHQNVDNDHIRELHASDEDREVLVRKNVHIFRNRALVRINYIRFHSKLFKFFYWGLMLFYGTVSKKVSGCFVLHLPCHLVLCYC